MSWETRGNNRYYYRRRKVAGRVVSQYIGAGELAQALAGLDDIDREQRRHEAAAWRQTIEDDRRHDEALAQVDDLVKAAVSAVLIAHGYHTHKRQWRKARWVRRKSYGH